jgi:uncharacterized protein (DUF2062 family)
MRLFWTPVLALALMASISPAALLGALTCTAALYQLLGYIHERREHRARLRVGR